MARSVDEPRSQLDATVKIFDQFYNFDLVVSADQYELVYSYFYSINKSNNISRNFTTILFRIAMVTGQNVLDLLEYIKGQNKLETNSLLTYYINSIKSKTTLYGISVVPQPNQNVQRNILQ